jgi:hypothetical protein
VRRGLPASLEHVAAGAPLTCGLTSKLTNQQCFPQVRVPLAPTGGCRCHKRGTTQTRCAHTTPHVCILCGASNVFSFAYLALPRRFSPPFQGIAIAIAIKDLLDLLSSGSSALVSSAVSCRLLSRVVCCLVFSAVSHPLPPRTLCCLMPSAVSYPLLSRTLCCTHLTRSGPPAADTHRWVPLSSPPRGTTQTRCAHTPLHMCILCGASNVLFCLLTLFCPAGSTPPFQGIAIAIAIVWVKRSRVLSCLVLSAASCCVFVGVVVFVLGVWVVDV